MASESEKLAMVKSKQYVLICRAGLAIPTYEMSADQIHEHMLTQYRHHVEKYRLPPHLVKMSKDRLFRTNKHLHSTVTEKDLRTGMSLWRKFASIKKYIVNVITPIYNKNLGSDSKLPSGFNMDSILFKTRQHLYEAEQLKSKEKSKNPAAFKMTDFKVTWYPVEWECFLTFGKCSDKPEKGFTFE